ncbi:class I SAM-dependent methyltransferase [Halovivax cerinus]|uniref:Class I SAM-dependent methyltransferase n=1 Tax=Halovivax cerinus TaxID=1487865 RepID=A0ABD5NLI6_9EURY|nr:methyltransferase domain-containing protein [Halovivax cerinus]
MTADRTDTDDLDHPLFARLYRAFDPIDRRTFGPHRRDLASDLAGRVVDLGAGDGAMFPYVVAGPRGTARTVDDSTGAESSLEYHAVEPDRTMRRRARSRAADVGLTVSFHDARAEALPFEDDSVDVVVSSLVFCSVDDPDAARSELARVLRPGGEVRFLEHVGGSGRYRTLQNAVTPVWKRVAGGCHLNRDTAAQFDADARFETVECVDTGVRTYPAAPVVRGQLRLADA